MPRGLAYVLTLLVLGLAMLAGGVGARWERFPPIGYEFSIEPERPGQEDSIRRAAFGDGTLWLLSDAGTLSTVREHVVGAQNVTTPEATFDICVQGGRPVIATAPRNQAEVWTLRRWEEHRWAEIGTVPIQGDGLVAIACEATDFVLLTSRRLFEFPMGKPPRAVLLSNRVPSGPQGTLLATPDYLFVGLNAGEFGGGLQRVDRRTGEVRELQSNESHKLCGGPLNPGCDPVNAVTASPWRPGCVVAAVGLVHMGGHGRLVEVCGQRIRSLYSEPCGQEPAATCSTPFFGVISDGNHLLAVAPGKLVSLHGSGAATHERAADLEAYGPFRVAFQPSYVLVGTSANQRHSLSGMTPLIVSR